MESPVEARHYRRLDDGKVKCGLCPHNCTIAPGKTGICSVRSNRDGMLITEIYGRLTAVAMDPIEKKPLYHFYPGSSILSIGTKGCNFKCPYCQNWHISQDIAVETSYKSPEDVVELALRNNSVGIAYTYSEPAIWFEYVMDTSQLARGKGLVNVMVTNGFINEAPLIDLVRYVDAMNIDLKSFCEDTYKKVQKGHLEGVKKTIAAAHERGCHVEVTTLVVTGINDTMDEMKDIIDFLAGVDKNIPWHISRYYPSYKYNKPATDVGFILEVYREAVKKLNFVYCGNISSDRGGSDTVCPSCKTVVIKRWGYRTSPENVKNGMCAKCGADLKIRM